MSESGGHEEYQTFRQYAYASNQNLVLQAENRPRGGGDGGASGEASSLRGRMPGKFGDRAGTRERPKEISDRMEKRKKRQQKGEEIEFTDRDSTELAVRKRRKGQAGNVLDALEEFESSRYRPRTAETKQVYESLLSFTGVQLGDQPQDVLKNAVEEMLTVLKDDSLKEPEKKRAIQDFMGEISEETFAKLTNLSKKVTDFKVGEDMEESALDDKLGVNVVIDEEEEEEDEGNELDEIREEEMSDGDGDAEAAEVARSGLQAGELSRSQYEDSDFSKSSTHLDPALVDAYWLQRQLSRHFKDPRECQKAAESVLEKLGDKNTDERDLENTLVVLLDYDFQKFDIVRNLLQNRFKIYLCTKLARAASEEEKSSILEDARKNELFSEVIDEMENGPRDARRQHRSSADASSSGASSSGIRAMAVDERQPSKRQLVDLESLSFAQEGHLMSNKKCKLPPGSFRTSKRGYEEVHVPAPVTPKFGQDEKLISIEEIPEWARPAFKNMKHLNRVQSRLYEAALYGADNLLLCAPTGAGKTNVAMLTILHELGLHRNADGSLDLEGFKIVYVAPMKALVQEVTANFSNRLEPFGISVRELTGDQQLTKQQIADTQIIVTTPEKWDIVTRKSGDRTYTSLVKLIIIDEIHLLHDGRGPVLECLVARMLRQIETTQEMIRIVGLSATLPNYKDVAAFLRVDPASGLFHFDNSYRPVPLQQQYIGITERKALKRKQLMDQITYDKVMDHAGKSQVLVFVHSRRETSSTARMLRDMALENDTLGLFLAEDAASREILSNESEEMSDLACKDLVPYGFATHHAGMSRKDRTMVEDLFAANHIKVLVSTATLAWGVNLPAHCVIIKGTQVYNPEKGRWTELSPLDIMQMFGRAGRPQFDTEGEGIIITSHSELQYYLSLLNEQLPIESQLISRLPDHLNGEIVLGTVQNAQEAVNWLGYTYLFVRMLRNPTLYGLTAAEVREDPTLESRRNDLIHTAASVLDKHNLVKYDKKTGNFQVTDLGRVSSHFYISYSSMAVYNEHLKPNMSDIDIFRLFSLSNEFKFMTVREEEKLELQRLVDRVPIPIKESIEEPTAKVNVLLQAYISQLKLDGFALNADMVFIQQSAGRIMRALFEVVLRRGWGQLTEKLLGFCKMIDKRSWASQSPLRQFRRIPEDLVRKIEKKDFTWERFYDMTPQEIGELVRVSEAGKSLHRYIHKIPKLELASHVQPITRSLLRVELTLTPDFQWDDKIHGGAEPFWVLIFDGDCERVMHFESFVLKGKYVEDDHYMTFTVPISEPVPPQYFIKVVSDRWLGSETLLPISFRHLILPERYPAPTELLDLQPLPVSALRNPKVEALYSDFKFFNPIQTQVFTSLFNTPENVLVCAPPGSGKTICAEFAILRLLNECAAQNVPPRIVYVSPTESIAEERFVDWENKFGAGGLGIRVVKLTGETSTDLQLMKIGNLVVSSSEHWDLMSRRWKKRRAVQEVKLFIADELHLIGGKDGPTMEVAVSRMRFIGNQLENGLRIVGLSASLANARDVGEWLGASSSCIFNFDPKVHSVAIQMQGFDQPTFHSRMLAMSKPTYQAIKNGSRGKPVLVFVPTKKYTRQVAIELLTFCSSEEDPDRFLQCSKEDIAPYLEATTDKTLQQTLEYGCGYYHPGMVDTDREIVKKLFKIGAIQVCITTVENCWGMDLNAYMVVIVNSQLYDGREHRYVDYPVTDILQMMGRACRPLEDDEGKCVIFCHGPRKEYYKKFVHEPLPVESHLDHFLADHLNSEIVIRLIENKQDAIDYLTWTFLYRRLTQNPNYYNLQGVSHQHLSDYLSELIESVLGNLEASKCIAVENDMDVMPLNFGIIASYFNIRYTTVELFGASLKSRSKLRGLVEILCSATEFEDIPIRHHEERLLRKLSHHLPLPLHNAKFTDPHSKVNVLLQAHFSNRRLNADMQDDLHTVLPTSLRLLQAIVDIISSMGWLNPALATMEMSQMLVQGLWNKDSILKQLPHFTDEIIARCEAKEIENIYDIINMEDEDRNEVLQMNEEQLADVARVCNMYPNLECNFGVLNKDPIREGSKVFIGVELEREDEDPYIGPVHAPRFPVDKDENWWVVVGSPKKNQLLCIKRVPVVGVKPLQIKLDFVAPAPGHYDCTLYLMSDCYLGCDQEFEIEFDVVKESGSRGSSSRSAQAMEED